MPSRSAAPMRTHRQQASGRSAGAHLFSADETDAALGRKVRAVLEGAGTGGIEILPLVTGAGGEAPAGHRAATWEIRTRGEWAEAGAVYCHTSPSPSQSGSGEWSALDDALARARARGERRVAEILAGDDMLTGEEFGARIGITRQGVDKRRRAGELIALEGPARGLRYPDWQIGPEGQMVDGIGEVLALAGGEPWTAYRLLVEPFPDSSGNRVCDVLRRGERERALAQLRGVVEGAAA